MNLLDLGHDELRQICALVGPKDISSVAMSCRRLREMAFMVGLPQMLESLGSLLACLLGFPPRSPCGLYIFAENISHTLVIALQEDYWEKACNSLVRNAAYSLQHEDLRSFKRWLNASTFRVVYRVCYAKNGSKLLMHAFYY